VRTIFVEDFELWSEVDEDVPEQAEDASRDEQYAVLATIVIDSTDQTPGSIHKHNQGEVLEAVERGGCQLGLVCSDSDVRVELLQALQRGCGSRGANIRCPQQELTAEILDLSTKQKIFCFEVINRRKKLTSQTHDQILTHTTIKSTQSKRWRSRLT
jgi:hypothetical protein